MTKNESGQGEVAIAAGLGILLLLVFVGIPFTWIGTAEWRRDVSGRAKLAEARNASKVKTEKAKANLESQKLNAKAELVRAKGYAKSEVAMALGTAEAVKIENGAITDSYTRYLYVKNLAKAKVIYVPTEAGLPIIEAGKR